LGYSLPWKKAKDVSDAMIKLLKSIKAWLRTTTYDNGKEFALHKKSLKHSIVMHILPNCITHGRKVKMRMQMVY